MMDGSSVLLLIRVLFSLVFVLAALVLAARWLQRRQLGQGRSSGPRPDVPVSVLSRQGLSRTASLSVVQVGSQILVLGVTETQVSLLSTVDPADAVAPVQVPAPTSLQDALPGSFGAALRTALLTEQGSAAQRILTRLTDAVTPTGRHRGPAS